jgi:hypothetical protein
VRIARTPGRQAILHQIDTRAIRDAVLDQAVEQDARAASDVQGGGALELHARGAERGQELPLEVMKQRELRRFGRRRLARRRVPTPVLGHDSLDLGGPAGALDHRANLAAAGLRAPPSGRLRRALRRPRSPRAHR